MIIYDILYAGGAKPNSSSGGGGGGLSGTFPSEPITADSENYFCTLNGDTEQFLSYKGDVAYLGTNEDSWKVLDKDESDRINYTKIWFKFKEPIAMKTLSINIYNNIWKLYATNDEDMLKNSIANDTIDSNYGTALIESGSSTNGQMADLPINKEGVAYKYYMFDSIRTNAMMCEIALKTE